MVTRLQQKALNYGMSWGIGCGAASGDEIDLTGNGNDATVADAAARAATGLDALGPDGSLESDGADTILTVGTATEITNVFAGGGSLFCILDLDSDGENSQSRVFVKGEGSGNWQIVALADTGTLYTLAFLKTFDGDDGQWNTGQVMRLNTPQVYALSYDQDDTSNDPVVVTWNSTDGKIVRTVGDGLTEMGTPTGSAETGTGSLWLCNDPTLVTTVDGHVDELYLFQTALTQAQLEYLVDLAAGELDSYLPAHRAQRNMLLRR